jgi:hypothetical protein
MKMGGRLACLLFTVGVRFLSTCRHAQVDIEPLNNIFKIVGADKSAPYNITIKILTHYSLSPEEINLYLHISLSSQRERVRVRGNLIFIASNRRERGAERISRNEGRAGEICCPCNGAAIRSDVSIARLLGNTTAA